MIRIAPLGRALAVAAAASLALTACGGGDEDTAAPAESSAPASSAPAAAKGDGTLTIGTLLPQTGDLAFLGPPEFAGVDLAVEEINAAGGVLGKPVTKIHTDSGDAKTDIASQSVDKLLQQKADAILGAASSGVSFTVIDKIVNAGVVHFSPANTSPDFTTYTDKGLYFRTAPSDVLQGRVLGDLIIQDGSDTVAILNRQDSYGTGLATEVKKSVESGGGTVTDVVEYDPGAADFSADVAKIKAKNPKALALIAFDETKKIIPELKKQGLGPDKIKIYFVDGNLADYSKDFPKGTLTGVKGTQPGAQVTEDFKAKLLKVNPELKDFNYGPESYDAAMLTALAAVAAKDDSGTAIASKLVDVSKGGEKCTEFKACADLLAAGKDIDYDGVSGPVEFSDAGDPSEATIGVFEYGDDNVHKNVNYLSGKVSG
ncbi:branched-chain amino acid transport system substrate-binding protein [Thermocatellispora tengchongensis]|uniref:Branched-chain amino acid transport system substrate-binding protein n=1 Tax=Thermocatellispora tengchongensis TaxID=1073253 RepID=A0A840P3G2_9ACTN|nr:ABC transporter substrate-binding protein [Thermocatellispora tengchongensis]MBB5131787.1 branched-chain amino acid transport system substrate-binding protein [Thermocatellispora tengchongensis]